MFIYVDQWPEQIIEPLLESWAQQQWKTEKENCDQEQLDFCLK